MKRLAWHWILGVSAVALTFAACEITSDDDEDNTGGSGGTTATGGSAGAATGGSAGAATGGSAGAATGGAAGEGGEGGGAVTCDEAFEDATDTCAACLIGKCCSQIEACVNEESLECLTSYACFVEKCTDPEEYDNCKAECDEGNFNTNYNEIIECLENNCMTDCS